jgi:uncharacterized membrane protein
MFCLAILVLLNNFLHDFSAAGWLFGSVLLWSILRRQSNNRSQTVAGILSTVLLLMRLSFVGIVVFGVVRVAAYRGYEWNEAAGRSQITLLVVKHIIFAIVFAAGLFCYVRAGRLVRRIHDEETE